MDHAPPHPRLRAPSQPLPDLAAARALVSLVLCTTYTADAPGTCSFRDLGSHNSHFPAFHCIKPLIQGPVIYRPHAIRSAL